MCNFVRNDMLGLSAITILLLVAGFLGEILSYAHILNIDGIATICSNLGKLVGIIVLANEGTLVKKSFYFVATLTFCGLIFLSGLFVIMHYPFSFLLYLIGLLGIMVFYTLHFIEKKTKKSLDILKWSWVVFYVLSGIIVMHGLAKAYISNELISFMENALFILLMAVFTTQLTQENS